MWKKMFMVVDQDVHTIESLTKKTGESQLNEVIENSIGINHHLKLYLMGQGLITFRNSN